MTTMTAIRMGMREVGRRKKILWTWYGLNLLCAIVIVAPLALAVAGMLGESLENKRLFDNFDLSWLTEFGWDAHWEQFMVWMPFVVSIGAAFVLMTTWLTGGLLAVLRDPKESFFGGCARWFPPFLRLFMMALVGYAIGVAARGGVLAVARKFGDDSMSAQPMAYGSMVGYVLFFALLLFINMIVDFAKIHMVVHGDRAARRGLRAAFRFVFARFRRNITIYLVLTGYGLLMLAAYHIWSEVIGQGSIGAVLLLFVSRQVYMFGRTWLRMVFLASEHAWFVSTIPKAPEPLPPIQESIAINESV
ncbi:MAG TPA: hypothetical protein VGL53_21270 [Bryobacteraceae bacterium]